MNYREAIEVVKFESLEGVAYSSRWGKYPDRKRVDEIIEALKVIQTELRGQPTIDRDLAASLFVINDQYQGNMSGAKEKGVELGQEVFDHFIKVNEVLYSIFEDWEEDA